MLANFINGISGYLRYKGGAAQFTFLMHRASGVGTLIFLSAHILLESTVRHAPHLYNRLNQGLQHPLALVAELVMAFFVIFHGVNGFRIAYFDLFHPDYWSPLSGPQSARTTWIISLALWSPTLVIMLLHRLHVI